MPPRISLIAAVARNGVIGRDGALPWHIPDDLRRFKALTMGHAMIMGRRTFESIGRLLPGRRTVVVSRRPGYGIPGARVAASLEDALAITADETEVFIVGGGAIYSLALPCADRLLLTDVDLEPEGDAVFPPVDRAGWRELARTRHLTPDGVGYAFVDLERVR